MQTNAATSQDAQTESLLKLVDESRLNLILLRHGQPSDGVGLKGFVGPPLSVIGQQQAARAAQRLATLPLHHIYASDMARAYQTAEAVRAFHPKTPFRCLPDIREISGFQVRGRPQARQSDDRRTLHQERERVNRFASYLRRTHKPGQLVAIIAHNGLNGMLLAEMVGLVYRRSIFFHSCHTGVTVANVSLTAPTISLRLMGCTRHLAPRMVSR